MYTYLVNDIFPALGEIFAALSELASMPFGQFVEFLGGSRSIIAENLITGEAFAVTVPSNIITLISNAIFNFLSVIVEFFDFADTPVWICLCMWSFTIFMGLYIVRFVLDIIPFA